MLTGKMAMRHPAPLIFLLTLLFLTQARIVQFWQWVRAIIFLSTFSHHVSTVIKSGGISGGIKSPVDVHRSSMQEQGV